MLRSAVLESQFDIDEVPCVPDVLLHLRPFLLENSMPVKEIISTILLDPALTLRLLALIAEKTPYEHGQPHAPLIKSINGMGLNPIRFMLDNQILFYKNNLLKTKSLFDLHEYWKHSVFTAFAAEILAKHLGYSSPEEAYIAGLLHDIGKLIIASFAPAKSLQIQRRNRKNEDLHLLEQRLLKTTHHSVGEDVCSQLNLPVRLQQAVRWHDSGGQNQDNRGIETPLTKIVYVANSISKLFCERGHRTHFFHEAEDRAVNCFNLSPGKFREILRDVTRLIITLIEKFNLHDELIRDYCLELENNYIKSKQVVTNLEIKESELEKSENQVNMLTRLILPLSKQAEMKELLLALAEGISEFTPVRYVVVFLYDRRLDQLVNTISFGLPAGAQMRWAKLPTDLKDSIIVRSFKKNENHNVYSYGDLTSMDINNSYEEKLLSDFPFGVLSLTKKNEPLGVIYVSLANPGLQIDTELFEYLVKTCSYVTGSR